MANGGNSGSAPRSGGGGRIKLNVGGKLFETTVATLQSGGPDSLLSALSTRPDSPTGDPIFIDRDPEVFSVLLSLLRSNRLPSTAARYSKQELADEASYYGIEAHLRAAMSPPALSGPDASMVSTVLPAADGLPSAFSAGEDGSLWIAHGGQISSFDWALCHVATIRTHLDEVSSILRVFPEVAAVGSSDSGAGLHFYDLAGSRHVGSVHWTDPADPRVYKARVASITDSPDHVFAAFDCPHRENSVLSIDKITLQTVSEIGRQPGSSSKSIVPRKLTWIPRMGALVGSAITCGAFGYSGYIRIWDPRAGSIVWETNEPGSGRSSRYGDSFADVDVDAENSLLFKVCSKSGDLAMADMRSLRDDPWVYLEDKISSLSHNGGQSSLLLHCYKDQVFVGRDGALEVWSKVAQRGEVEETAGGGLYRRNFVDKEEDSLRGIISKIEGGGNRLFISREDMEGIEVWESSHLSGVTPISPGQIR